MWAYYNKLILIIYVNENHSYLDMLEYIIIVIRYKLITHEYNNILILVHYYIII